MKKRIVWFVLFCLFLLPVTAEASSSLILNYNGKTITYKDTQLKATYNGKVIDLKSTPGILKENNALFSYQDMFIKSDIHATGNYNSTTKKITIERNDIKIIMKLGSKTAKVNGVSKTMPSAPLKVTYKKAGKTKILVPSRFVAENLGLIYNWYSKTGTVSIEDSTVTPTISLNDVSEDVTNIITIPKIDSNIQIIESKDDYWNRQFIITLQGDYTSNLNDSNILIEDSTRAKVSVQLDENMNTDIIIKTNIIRGFVLEESENSFIITIKPPKEVYDKILVLDAGHGGSQTGTLGDPYGNDLIEKEVTLDLVLKAKEYFDEDSTIKVYYTRLDDSTRTLSERAKIANEVEADLFISVHIDSYPSDSTVCGTKVFYSSKVNQQHSTGLTASDFASIVSGYLVEAVGSVDRGVDKNSYQVLNESTMPAILIETAFISNEEDVEILQSEEKKEEISAAIYNSVVETFGTYMN